MLGYKLHVLNLQQLTERLHFHDNRVRAVSQNLNMPGFNLHFLYLQKLTEKTALELRLLA